MNGAWRSLKRLTIVAGTTAGWLVIHDLVESLEVSLRAGTNASEPCLYVGWMSSDKKNLMGTDEKIESAKNEVEGFNLQPNPT